MHGMPRATYQVIPRALHIRADDAASARTPSRKQNPVLSFDDVRTLTRQRPLATRNIVCRSPLESPRIGLAGNAEVFHPIVEDDTGRRVHEPRAPVEQDGRRHADDQA